jgi:hypothetical protein
MRCTLTTDELVTRGARWRALGPGDVADLENGLRLSFPARVEVELRELAELERDCCAFANWDVIVHDGRAVLEITAEGESVVAVQALFASLRS